MERPVETAQATPPALPVPPAQATHPASPKTDDFYRYTDDDNVVHIVNDETKIPEQFRSRAVVVASGLGGGPGTGPSNVTPVDCRGNRVLVPVTLNYRGREVRTVLVLDTGAGVTTISEQLATRLGVNLVDTRLGTSTVADGRKLTSYHFNADIVAVGERSLPGVEVSVLPGSGGNGAEGLLGMNFLKEFRYHVDFKRGVIEWGKR